MQLKYRSGTRLLFIFLFIISTLTFSCASLSQSSNSKKQAELVRLGNPSAEDGLRGRSLNVWDLQSFEQKIYLGAGSVAQNVGPISVWAYDPAKKTFIDEYTVPDEAIEHFQVIDDSLYIPAADPRSNDNIKYYHKPAGGEWEKIASPAVKLAHVRDIHQLEDQGLLIVGNGRSTQPKNRQPPGAALVNRSDATVVEVEVTGFPQADGVTFIDSTWFLSVFSFEDRIYALNSLLRDTGGYTGYLAKYNPQTQKLDLDWTIGAEEFIPLDNLDKKAGKYGRETIYHLWQTEEYGGDLVYTVKTFSNANSNGKNYIKQNYLNSLGLFVKQSMGQPPQEIRFNRQAVGEDILAIDGELYALANQKHRQEDFTVSVYKTTTPAAIESWNEVLSFKSTNRARSFAYLDNTFYFGLGQDRGEAIASSGDILSYTLP